MDLLDSILNGMEKPPSVKKPVIKDKEKREKFEKMYKEKQEAERKQKKMLEDFREYINKKIDDFIKTPSTDSESTIKLQLKPMNKFYRTIVYESCETHEDDIVVHSFGTEDVDRHCIIWKKGFEPCDDELRAMKLGVEYKPKTEEDDDDDDNNDDADGKVASSSKTADGKDKFWSKYEKIIGENAAGIECAKIAQPAKQYGCVPIEQKKDLRSIEEITNDIRKSKKQKTSDKAAQQDEPDTTVGSEQSK